MIKAIGYPRLNWSLVDMAGVSKRMYGSFGVAIKANPIVVEARNNKVFILETKGYIEERTKSNILLAINRAKDLGLNTDCHLIVTSNVRQHTGLGSSSQIILTILDAINALNNWGLSAQQIIGISGRGRTTLIGCATHYYGGFCIDGGQAYMPDSEYLSSHTPRKRQPALYIGSWQFPKEWKISFVGEASPVAIDPMIEDQWIQDNVPNNKEAAISTIIELYHGVLPAVIEVNYNEFALSLNSIQIKGWNTNVIKAQTEQTKQMLNTLWGKGVAAAISSLGPLITVVHTIDKANDVYNTSKEYGLSYSGPYDVLQKFEHEEGKNPFIERKENN